jgi:hypothetical protein
MIFLDLPETEEADPDDPKIEGVDYHGYNWPLQ